MTSRPLTIPANRSNPRGDPQRITLPEPGALDGLTIGDRLAGPRQVAQGLRDRLVALSGELAQLKAARHGSGLVDRQADAARLLAGEPPQGDITSMDIDASIKRTEREAEVVSLALRHVGADVVAIAADLATITASETETLRSEARQQARDALGVMRAAIEREAALEAVGRWVRKPSAAATPVYGRVAGLVTGSQGEEHRLLAVLDALQADLAEAEIERLPGIFRAGDKSRPEIERAEDGTMRRPRARSVDTGDAEYLVIDGG